MPNIANEVRKGKNNPQFPFRFHTKFLKVAAEVKFLGRDTMF